MADRVPDDEALPSVSTSTSLRLGVLLAIAGGFLDAYTYISRNGVFANAQTGNVVLFAVGAARADWAQALRHVPPIIAFIGGVATAETLQRPRVHTILRWPLRGALVVEFMVLVVVGFLPTWVPDIIVTVTIAYVASVQNATFRTLTTWSYNTTMTTGNLRTAVRAAYLAIAEHDPAAKRQAGSFFTVVFAFAAGALLGGVLTELLQGGAAWCAAGFLAAGLLLFIIDERQR